MRRRQVVDGSALGSTAMPGNGDGRRPQAAAASPRWRRDSSVGRTRCKLTPQSSLGLGAGVELACPQIMVPMVMPFCPTRPSSTFRIPSLSFYICRCCILPSSIGDIMASPLGPPTQHTPISGPARVDAGTFLANSRRLPPPPTPPSLGCCRRRPLRPHHREPRRCSTSPYKPRTRSSVTRIT